MCLAIPGKIIVISGEEPLSRMGQIAYGGITKEASLAFVPDAKEDDYVLVHAGIAISIVREDEAQKIFEYLEQIGEAEA